MLIRQGRIWAATIEKAIEAIRAKHGPGELRIYPALVHWLEYNIEVGGTP